LNYFAFELDATAKIDEFIRPTILNQVEDRADLKEQRVTLGHLTERVCSLEVIFNMQKGKNVIFDKIIDKINSLVSRERAKVSIPLTPSMLFVGDWKEVGRDGDPIKPAWPSESAESAELELGKHRQLDQHGAGRNEQL